MLSSCVSIRCLPPTSTVNKGKRSNTNVTNSSSPQENGDTQPPYPPPQEKGDTHMSPVRSSFTPSWK
eukprot:1779205-Rhodomonas_salina.4